MDHEITCITCFELKRAFAVATLNEGRHPELYKGKAKDLGYFEREDELHAATAQARRALLAHQDASHNGEYRGE
jgi:hypothetical protein